MERADGKAEEDGAAQVVVGLADKSDWQLIGITSNLVRESGGAAGNFNGLAAALVVVPDDEKGNWGGRSVERAGRGN